MIKLASLVKRLKTSFQKWKISSTSRTTEVERIRDSNQRSDIDKTKQNKTKMIETNKYEGKQKADKL